MWLTVAAGAAQAAHQRGERVGAVGCLGQERQRQQQRAHQVSGWQRHPPHARRLHGWVQCSLTLPQPLIFPNHLELYSMIIIGDLNGFMIIIGFTAWFLRLIVLNILWVFMEIESSSLIDFFSNYIINFWPLLSFMYLCLYLALFLWSHSFDNNCNNAPCCFKIALRGV